MSEKISPEIRFKWFTDDWEPRKLGEIAEIIGGGTPSTNNPTYWDGDIDWYAPAEIGEQIFAKGSVRKITKEGLSHCSARILPAYKTVLFTSRAGIGNMAILQHPAATNQGFQSLVCHNDIEPYFVFSMGNNIKAAAECVATGSTFDEISGKKLSKLEFMFPDIAEQQVIGACFKNIDMLITIHKHKLTKLQLLKKSMLTKMFPKDGARVPEIRFRGFHGDWEQRTLGEIAKEKLSNGLMNNQSDEPTKVRHINVIDMYTPDKIHISDLTYSKYDEAAIKKCNVEYGDIFMTRSSLKPEGIAEANVLLNSGKYVYDDHLIRLKVIQNAYDPIFVKISLGNKMIKSQFIQKSKTAAFTTIGQDDVAGCSGMFPCYKEQQKIGNYFMNLDYIITLHQRKLSKLQKIKQAMLSKLFV